jgi:exportin-7
LLSSQSTENQQQLDDAFNKLLQDVSRNLDSANRERFTQKLTAFRVTARNFLSL